MNTLRRISSGVFASIEWVTSQVENHEALAKASVQAMEKAICKARMQMQRVKKDGLALESSLEKAEKDVEIWRGRALGSEGADESKGLECLRRMNGAVKEVELNKQLLLRHLELEKKLQQDLLLLESKLGEVKRKKNLLSARQGTAEAQNFGEVVGQAEDIFDRWELSLSECSDLAPEVDTFAAQFETEEELSSLRSQLEGLKNG